MSEEIFICDRCKKPGLESMWQYKELNICTKCANKMRDNTKRYNSDLRAMEITDIKQYGQDDMMLTIIPFNRNRFINAKSNL